jgi:hypothetical protein
LQCASFEKAERITAPLWSGGDNFILLFKVVIGCSRLLTGRGVVSIVFKREQY